MSMYTSMCFAHGGVLREEIGRRHVAGSFVDLPTTTRIIFAKKQIQDLLFILEEGDLATVHNDMQPNRAMRLAMSPFNGTPRCP